MRASTATICRGGSTPTARSRSMPLRPGDGRTAAASRQPEHAWALALADGVIAEAKRRGSASSGVDRRRARRPDPAGPYGWRADRLGRDRPRPPPRPPRPSSVRAQELASRYPGEGDAGAPGGALPYQDPRGARRACPSSRTGRSWPLSESVAPRPTCAPRSPLRRSRGRHRSCQLESASSVAAPSAGSTPPIWRPCPTSRCGHMTSRQPMSTRSTVTACGSSATPSSSRSVHARTDAREIPPCQLGIVATKGTLTRSGDRSHRADLSRRRGLQRAERDRQRGGDRRVRARA